MLDRQLAQTRPITKPFTAGMEPQRKRPVEAQASNESQAKRARVQPVLQLTEPFNPQAVDFILHEMTMEDLPSDSTVDLALPKELPLGTQVRARAWLACRPAGHRAGQLP